MNIENRPKMPGDMLKWAKQARNCLWVHCLTYGEEHWDERAAALDQLLRWNEEAPLKYTDEFVRDAWEELNSRWWEELNWKV